MSTRSGKIIKSRKFLPREKGYAVVEKECLAVKSEIHEF